jgi:hypothetical protein
MVSPQLAESSWDSASWEGVGTLCEKCKRALSKSARGALCEKCKWGVARKVQPTLIKISSGALCEKCKLKAAFAEKVKGRNCEELTCLTI